MTIITLVIIQKILDLTDVFSASVLPSSHVTPSSCPHLIWVDILTLDTLTLYSNHKKTSQMPKMVNAFAWCVLTVDRLGRQLYGHTDWKDAHRRIAVVYITDKWWVVVYLPPLPLYHSRHLIKLSTITLYFTTVSISFI